MISDPGIGQEYTMGQWRLPEVCRGEIWRLVTPIFLHFGFVHVAFNMLWLMELGLKVERAHGPWITLVMILVLGITSNLAQSFVSGPRFGGMSGVVYGLLGYVWLRSKYDPTSGLHLRKAIVIMMIIWYVLGVTGLFCRMANTAHGVGLAIGMFWGYASAKLRNRRG